MIQILPQAQLGDTMQETIQEKRYYARNLPHWQPEDGVFFITGRLDGSLPISVILQLQALRDAKIDEIRKNEPQFSDMEVQNAIKAEKELYFGKFDDLLDNPTSGPVFLAQKPIAQLLANTFQKGFEKEYFKLVCFTIMSNHFHAILCQIKRPLFRITQSIKSTTGIDSNRILERTNGEKFWQRETYDRLIRDEKEFIQKMHYTLNNPVKVGLVKNWRDWEFNYLNPEFEEYAPE